MLKKSGFKLFLAINQSLIGDPSLEALLRDAEEEGVEVGAWLLLSYDEGYWPNEKNAEAFLRLALDFVEWYQKEGLKIDRIIVDMETGYQRLKAIIEEGLMNGNVFYLLHDLESNIDPDYFNYAKSIYSNLVENLRLRGIKSMVTTLPFLLDDLEDGDEDISDMLDIPVYGVNWDVVSFMVYRTLFNDIVGSMPSAGLVEAYANSAVRFFGERAAIDLGIAGQNYMESELSEDLFALCEAGVREFHIYALDTILSLPSPSSFLSSIPKENFAVNPEPLYILIHTFLKSLDEGR